MPFLRLPLTITIFLAANVIGAADLNSAVVAQMRIAVPSSAQIQILKRIGASSDLDLVVVMAGPKDEPVLDGTPLWWYERRTLGIFLQNRDHPGTVFKIATEKGPGCEVTRIEKLTAADLVMSCLPEKGDELLPNWKFVYDVRSKALTGKVEYRPFALSRLFLANEQAVLVGTDHKQVIAVQVDPSISLPRLLTGQASERWTNRVSQNFGLSGIGPESEIYVSLAPKPFRILRFGPENRFALAAKPKESDSQPAHGLWVTERVGKTMKPYRLPQSTYEEFSRARPEMVKNGWTREAVEFSEEIGSSQVFDGDLWFAKVFSDDEGETGIGGFGYFDTTERKFKIYSPPELVDSSVTAMLVEPEAVWLGLEVDGEWGPVAKGLLRFDRKTEKAVRIPLPDIIHEIARVRERLVLATNFGVALMEADGQMRRFFVDKTMRGHLQVSEAIAGK